MNLIDKLKELEAKAKSVPYGPGTQDERMDTHENFEFAYALVDAWPKFRELFAAAERAERQLYDYQEDVARLTPALDALRNQNS